MNKKELILTTLSKDQSMKKYETKVVEEMFWDEVDEYGQALEEVYIGQGPLELAQEGADVLRIAFELKSRGAATQSVEQAVVGVLRDFNDTGINYIDALAIKLERNSLKYEMNSPSSKNGHTPSQYHNNKREIWNHLDGDRSFYFAYMMTVHMLYPDEYS